MRTVSGMGGCLSRGGCLPEGRGVCLSYVTPFGQTDARENITFPQILLRTVISYGWLKVPILVQYLFLRELSA